MIQFVQEMVTFAKMDGFGADENMLFSLIFLMVRNYDFYFPLTILAWRRMGYDCIVMIFNDPSICKDN